MSEAEIIRDLIRQAAPRIAVVFSGDKPRLIGTLEAAPSEAAVKDEVNRLLFAHGLRAEKVSLGRCFGKLFVGAHG